MSPTLSEADLRNAASKAWKKPLGDELAARLGGLVADPVGSWNPERPHPMITFMRAGVGPLLQGDSRALAFSMSAKLFVALANGGASTVFDVLDRAEAGHVRVGAGFWVERSPRDGGGPDRPYFPYDDEWDWHRFEQLIASPEGRDLVSAHLEEDEHRFVAVSRFHDELRSYVRFRVRNGTWMSCRTSVVNERVQPGEEETTRAESLFDAITSSAAARAAWVSVWIIEEDIIPIEQASVVTKLTRRLEQARPFLSAVAR